MVDLEKPGEVRRLFLDFLLLKQIKDSAEGISGYELHKKINQSLSSKKGSSPLIINYNFSQSQVYRILEDLRLKGFLNVKEDVIVNKKLQNLFQINENGNDYLAYQTNLLKGLFPKEIVIENLIEDFISGKQSPFDFIFDALPETELLSQLKLFRKFLAIEIARVDERISKLEVGSHRAENEIKKG